MADFPDVVAVTGKLPHELGTLQVLVAAVHRVRGEAYVVTVMIQPAFEPSAETTLDFISTGGQALVTVHVPALEGGRVVKVRAPFQFAGKLERVGLKPSERVAPNTARRIRPERPPLTMVEWTPLLPSSTDALTEPEFTTLWSAAHG